MKQGFVYILKCSDGSYYTGCTSNLEQRIAQHETGYFEGYTSIRRPVTLVWSDHYPDMNQATAVERQIKGWTRKKKEALIHGDFKLLHQLAECKNDTHFRKNHT
jgi:predicted GIY-YIG superfamily endonuclease